MGLSTDFFGREMSSGAWRVTGALLLLGLALSNAAVTLRGDASSCRANFPSRSEQANVSSARSPITRLRGGKATMDSLATALDSLSNSANKVMTSTRLKQRTFFWQKGEEPPEAKSMKEGDMVMLQGFDWKLLSDRKTLYRQLALEMGALSAAGVNTVWFPPPSESADPQGYLPGRWYVIGNRTLLEAAISAAHLHGIVPMVDVVLNHRTAARISVNSSDWTDFEGPDWGEWAIVQDDWKCHPEEHLKICPDNCTCGGPDTGENACYAPDIDHTNPFVQEDIIEWLRWLRTDLGFDAFRFDNTKGYAGHFTNMYIEATDPMYAVSEYYDSNRNLVSGWLESSSRASSVFDFGMRYKLKESVKHDDFSLLMDEWMGPMLWYDKEKAITFTDNHDTAGNHHFEISDVFGTANQIAAGYAMILSHPSRPCIFWQDWMGENRDVIQQLLQIRQKAGISPQSEWKLVYGQRGLYAAFIGDKLAMKMGADDWDPNEGLPKPEWFPVASGDVSDVVRLPPVEPRVVPVGHMLLLDATLDAEGHDGQMIKTRVTAFCPEKRDPAGLTEVTVRVYACNATWPWPANNDDSKRVRDTLTMHYAAGIGSSAEWGRPADDMLPAAHSWRVDDAVQTLFEPAVTGPAESKGWDELEGKVSEVRLSVPAGIKAVQFVLKHPAQYHDSEDRWYKADGDFHRPPADFHIRLPRAPGDGGPFWCIWERMEEEAQPPVP